MDTSALIGVIGGVSGLLGGLWAYLTSRDKLRYDSRMALMESDAKRQGERLAVVEAGEKQCQQENSELREKYIRADETAKRESQERQKVENQVRELESQVNELRERIDQRNSP